MAEYKAFAPNNEVIGQTILSTVIAIGEEVRPLLEKHGLTDLRADGWYPQQAWLDAMNEIIEEGDFGAVLDIVHVGMEVGKNAVVPPQVDTFLKFLQIYGQAYQMNHRGDDPGSITTTVLSPTHAQVNIRTPYPENLTFGIIYGMAQRLLPRGTDFQIKLDETLPSRKNGAESSSYNVTW